MYIYEEVITENIRPIDLAIKVTIFTSLYSLTVFKKYITYFFLCHLKVYKTYNFYKNAWPVKKERQNPIQILYVCTNKIANFINIVTNSFLADIYLFCIICY